MGNCMAKQKCKQNHHVGRNWVNHNQKPCVHYDQGHPKIKEQVQTTTPHFHNGMMHCQDLPKHH